MGGDISDAVQVVNVSMQVGGKVVSMPFKVVGTSFEIIQKILAIMELSRRMKPEKGEVIMDKIYEKYGNQYTTFSIPNEYANKARKALSEKGVEFSGYPACKEGETTFAVPLVQVQTVMDILENIKVECILRSQEEHAKEFENNYPNKLNEMTDTLRGKGAAEKSGNFNQDGLTEAFLISEYKEMLSDESMIPITVSRETVIQEEENTVRVSLFDGGTVEIDKKGLMPRNEQYVLFVNGDQMYHVQKGEKKFILPGRSLSKQYFSDEITSQTQKESYLAELELRLSELEEMAAAEEDKDIPVEPATEKGEPQVVPGVISIDMETLLLKENETEYMVRIPKYYRDHETDEKRETPNGGAVFHIEKSACSTDPEGKTIFYDTGKKDSYNLYDRKTAAVIGAITAGELYSNFDLVQNRRINKINAKLPLGNGLISDTDRSKKSVRPLVI